MNDVRWWLGALRPADRATAQAPPTWVETAERAMALGPRADPPSTDAPVAVAGAQRVAEAFGAVVDAGLSASPHAREDVVAGLAAAARRGLTGIVLRAVELDLAAEALIGGWSADDPRALEAARALGTPERRAEVLKANPCVARAAARRTELVVAAGHRLLAHLAQDAERIAAELLPDVLTSRVVELEALGDRHDGARQVLRLTFASEAQLMYKPRSLRTDVVFGELLDALAGAGLAPAPRGVRTLDAGPGHGWQEVVRAAGCGDAGGLDRHYRRLGALLAVLHALRATDVHAENLIAAGEHPLVIDLETLLQPRIGGHGADVFDALLSESGVQSVLRVGVLPRPDGAFGLDLCAIGREPSGGSGIAEGSWAQWALGPQAAAAPLQPGPNHARVGEERAQPHHHTEAVADGFAAAYALLVAHRAAWLAPGGPLAALADCPLRVLLRPTQVYTFLKQELVRKGACPSDREAQERLLELLDRAAPDRDDLAVVRDAERHDLLDGDVPRLTGRPGSADLHHHVCGRLAGALGDHPCPGPEVVDQLGPADLERQLAILRTALRASSARPEPVAAWSPPPGAPGDLRGAALALGERLAASALHDRDRVGWLTLTDRRPPRGGRVLAPTWLDLPDGLSGISLFLTALEEGPAPAAWLPGLRRAAGARLDQQRGAGAPLGLAERAGLALLAAVDPRVAAAGRAGDEATAADPPDVAAWLLGSEDPGERKRLAARLTASPGDTSQPLVARALVAGGADDAARRALQDAPPGPDRLLAHAALARGVSAAAAQALQTLPAVAEELRAAVADDVCEAAVGALGLLAAGDVLGDRALRAAGAERAGQVAALLTTPPFVGRAGGGAPEDAAVAIAAADGPTGARDAAFAADALSAAPRGGVDDASAVATAAARAAALARMLPEGRVTPGLRDGLAGVGLALLACEERDRAAATEVALLVARGLPRRLDGIPEPWDPPADVAIAGLAG